MNSRHNKPAKVRLILRITLRGAASGKAIWLKIPKWTSRSCPSNVRSRSLKSIVKRLEDGKVPLEELVAIYERGEALKRRCEELLRQAEVRVDKITTDATGQITGTEPLDVQ